MPQIFVFGDSITYGQTDEDGGWVSRLRKYVDNKLKSSNDTLEIYNFGIPGDTTIGVVNRFESDIKPRIKSPTIIIFAIGINDTYTWIKNNNINTPIEIFTKNLLALITLAKKHTNNIIFIGLTPVEEIKARDIENYYLNNDIKNYDVAISSLCLKESVYYIELIKDWLSSDYYNLLGDGLHPNSLGHKKIFETIKDFLEEKKLI